MMTTNLDLKIDLALNILANSENCIATSLDFDSIENLPKHLSIVELLCKRGFATPLPLTDGQTIFLPSCIITEKGADIVANGGWIKHLEMENKKAEIDFKKERIELSLAKLTIKSTKWNNVMTILNFVIAIINMFLLVWQIKG